MSLFYSPSRNGFFHAAIHGPRRILAPQAQGRSSRRGREQVMVEVDNPDTMVPVDAVAITAELHADLLAAQSAGKVVQPGADGLPVAVDPAPPTTEELWAAVRRRRDGLLKKSDWTQLPDVPAALRNAWAPRRQFLRDITSQPDAANIDWGQDPEVGQG